MPVSGNRLVCRSMEPALNATWELRCERGGELRGDGSEAVRGRVQFVCPIGGRQGALGAHEVEVVSRIGGERGNQLSEGDQRFANDLGAGADAGPATEQQGW